MFIYLPGTELAQAYFILILTAIFWGIHIICLSS